MGEKLIADTNFDLQFIYSPEPSGKFPVESGQNGAFQPERPGKLGVELRKTGTGKNGNFQRNHRGNPRLKRDKPELLFYSYLIILKINWSDC